MTTTSTVKLFAISMVAVGDMVSQREDGPYRKIVEIERFGDIRRIWLEPLPDSPEYLDRRIGDLLWQPCPPQPWDGARWARDVEGPAMYDTDMNRLDETPTAEQIRAAEDADGGWIWIDERGNPIDVIDEIRGDDGEAVPLTARFGQRDDLTKVCVA